MGFAADRAREDYSDGYREGYADGIAFMERKILSELDTRQDLRGVLMSKKSSSPKRATKKPRKKSKKVRILDEMAKKAWSKYKKGSGKKSYIDIRAQVSRSRDYKKKVKDL
jgi:hypothetical protein|tara:strand:+ start:464 stop:796 length:333 start_codon:yes stop_codon:yes gene_type:complete